MSPKVTFGGVLLWFVLGTSRRRDRCCLRSLREGSFGDMWVACPASQKPGLVVCARHPSTAEAETNGVEAYGHAQLL